MLFLSQSVSMISGHRLRRAVLFAVPGMVVWLANASAQPAVETAAETPSQFFASRIDSINQHVGQLVQAVPQLPAYFRDIGASFDRAAGLTSSGHIAMASALCLIAGVLVEWAFRRGVRGVRVRRHAMPISTTSDRLAVVGIDTAIGLGAVVAFALGALVTLAVVGRPGPINEAGSSSLIALVGLRLALAILKVLLRPSDGPERSLSAFGSDLATARFWYWHLSLFVGWFAVGWAVIVSLRAFGMPPDGRHLFAYVLGIGLVVIALRIIWHPSRRPNDAASAGKWLASAAALVFWVVWAANAMPFFWFLTVAIGLPLAVGVARRASRHLLRPVGPADGETTVPSVASVFVEQGLRALLIVGAVWILLWGWNLNVDELAAQENVYTRLLRGFLHALIIVLAADLAWSVIKALADNAIAKAQVTSGIDADEARRRARIRTLLPIGRNVALIVLLVMACLMVLAALGVEIGPLIASAGVVGVAVGFGAQTVVRDIISGMFYMLDDAFRIGEYIQSGSYKGTVESFSLRSIKLRHQRGPLFTIPFGALGAVQNMSRDWVIVKDVIGITHDSDIDKAKKLIKQIGLELAQDPDLGPSILQPLKMQGVEEFGEYGVRVRTKMMAKPGEQFVVRRRANAMIKKAFDANGIRFALPVVRVAHGDEEEPVAAAQQALKQPIQRSS